MRLIHDKANKRTKIRLAAASKELRHTLPKVGQSYIEGTGKYQKLWNLDREMRRWATLAKAAKSDVAVETLRGVATFVWGAKRRYKQLANAGKKSVSWSTFFDTHAQIAPFGNVMSMPRMLSAPITSSQMVRDMSHPTRRQHYDAAVQRRLFERMVLSPALPLKSIYHLEDLMDAVLLYANGVFAMQKPLVSRKRLQTVKTSELRRVHKEQRGLMFGYQGVPETVLQRPGVMNVMFRPQWGARFLIPLKPGVRAVVKKYAAKRRLERRGARRRAGLVAEAAAAAAAARARGQA